MCRPPPASVPAVTVDADIFSGDVAGNATAAMVEQQPPAPPPTTAAAATETSTVAGSGAAGLPTLDVQTNPELPSPARVRWMDAFSRVCAHLNQVSFQPKHTRALQNILKVFFLNCTTFPSLPPNA